MNNRISIIVPIYNVPISMLERCLESLIHQTYKNIEIVLVNDGSNESNVVVCKKYMRLDNRVKLISQENKGLSAARNTGVMNSDGDWITFVDGDDYLEKDGMKRIVSRLNTTPDVVCFGTIKEYRNSSFLYKFGNLFEDGKEYKEDSKIFLDVLFDFDSNISDATAKLYRRDFLVKEHILHDVEIRQGVEAFDFNFNVFRKAQNILFLKEYTYHYSYNENSITIRPSNNSYKQLIFGLEKVEKEVLELKDNTVTQAFYNRIKYIIITTLISGYFSPSVQESYSERKKGFNEFMHNPIMETTLKRKERMDFKRKVIWFFIEHNLYLPIYILARIRKLQKEH